MSSLRPLIQALHEGSAAVATAWVIDTAEAFLRAKSQAVLLSCSFEDDDHVAAVLEGERDVAICSFVVIGAEDGTERRHCLRLVSSPSPAKAARVLHALRFHVAPWLESDGRAVLLHADGSETLAPPWKLRGLAAACVDAVNRDAPTSVPEYFSVRTSSPMEAMAAAYWEDNTWGVRLYHCVTGGSLSRVDEK